MSAVFETYFSRFEAFPKRLNEAVSSDLGIIICIPCYCEDEVLRTIKSIRQCDMPDCDIEILVTVNYGEHVNAEIKDFNQDTYNQIKEFGRKYSTSKLKIFALSAFDIPRKQAGVGYARKVSMDEAVRRFAEINKEDGIIVSCDADTLVEKNYLKEIESFYLKNPNCGAANIYFEHDLEGVLQQEQYQAIAQYELYLRYYVEQLKRIKFPFSYHTIGSCFSIKAKTYCRQGGMNKRQAGEDFYFLQKLFQTEQVGEINTTRVIPSSRMSERVPFGTGPVLAKMVYEHQDFYTFTSDSFNILHDFFEKIPLFRDAQEKDLIVLYNTLNSCLRMYMDFETLKSKVFEFQRNTATLIQFEKRFFNWFNGLMVFKFLNFSCLHRYAKRPIVQLASEFLQANETDAFALLRKYREIQRK
ncbi:MAG: hypothetical protein MJ198_02255 [Bacteroidales bacterium]|nr:hypothetical protein [Bacteroidales bacterium]